MSGVPEGGWGLGAGGCQPQGWELSPGSSHRSRPLGWVGFALGTLLRWGEARCGVCGAGQLRPGLFSDSP